MPRTTRIFENELLMPDVVKLFFSLVVIFATVLCSNSKRPNTARATTVPVLEFVLTSDTPPPKIIMSSWEMTQIYVTIY